MPAETTSYMILGFAVIFGTMGIHLWSLYNKIDGQGPVPDWIYPSAESAQMVEDVGLLIFLLDGAAIEHGATQDPAIVDRDQVLFDQHLVVVTGKIRFGNQRLAVGTGQQVGNAVAVVAQFPGVLAPFPVLVAATLSAGVGLGREYTPVVAEPAQPGKRSTCRGFHIQDPLPVLLHVFRLPRCAGCRCQCWCCRQEQDKWQADSGS